MVKKCPTCGNEVEGNSRFCGKCGNSVDTETEVSDREALGENFLQSMSVKIGIFSAVIAVLVTAVVVMVLLLVVVVVVYNILLLLVGWILYYGGC